MSVLLLGEITEGEAAVYIAIGTAIGGAVQWVVVTLWKYRTTARADRKRDEKERKAEQKEEDNRVIAHLEHLNQRITEQLAAVQSDYDDLRNKFTEERLRCERLAMEVQLMRAQMGKRRQAPYKSLSDQEIPQPGPDPGRPDQGGAK